MQRDIGPFSYKIKKGEIFYLAGVENFSIDRVQVPRYDLFLDKLTEKNKIIWTPSLNNPFSFKRFDVEIPAREIYLPKIPLLKWSRLESFEGFCITLSCSLDGTKLKPRLSKEDIELFFKQLYEHYSNLNLR